MLHKISRRVLSTNWILTSRGFVTNKTQVDHVVGSLGDSDRGDDVHDPDVFGTLSRRGRQKLATHEVEKYYPDDKDGYDKEEYDLKPRKNAYYYKYEIGKYARQGPIGLKKALDLFKEMKSEARLTPSLQNFSPLFYGCAKAGYTKKAFELYEELLKYERKPSNSNITCLLDACAECPFPEYGLGRLEWFLTELKYKFNRNLNLVQYNAAIKAYGKLGKLEDASKLVQQMINQGLRPDLNTFQSLLIGCASNKESGCSIALRVFKRMKMYDIKPSTITYRILLRCIRDCGLGSNELIQETLRELPAVTSLDQRLEYGKRLPKKDKRFRQAFEWAPLYTDLGKSVAQAISEPSATNNVCKNNNLVFTSETNELQYGPFSADDSPKDSRCNLEQLEQRQSDNSMITQNETIQLPNVLSNDHLDLMTRIKGLQLDKLQSKSDRLMLFGGMYGFLEAMLKDGCKPDVKTFSLIVLCLKNDKENYLDFFKLSENFKIKRDVDFYDQLIWCVCRRFKDSDRLQLALNFIDKLHSDGLRPTISTFEALALGCNKWSEAKQMIDDLKRSNLVMSHGMISSFFEAAIMRRNYHFLINLMELSKKMGFRPSQECVEKLEALRVTTNMILVQREKAATSENSSDWLVEQFDEFTRRLDEWLTKIELREKDHPWDQYYVPSESKKDGFFDFVRHMNEMDKMKKDMLQQGRGNFGNIAYKAKKKLQNESGI